MRQQLHRKINMLKLCGVHPHTNQFLARTRILLRERDSASTFNSGSTGPSSQQCSIYLVSVWRGTITVGGAPLHSTVMYICMYSLSTKTKRSRYACSMKRSIACASDIARLMARLDHHPRPRPWDTSLISSNSKVLAMVQNVRPRAEGCPAPERHDLRSLSSQTPARKFSLRVGELGWIRAHARMTPDSRKRKTGCRCFARQARLPWVGVAIWPCSILRARCLERDGFVY